ncbi:putative type IV restriction endonuclease [Parabacteroides sp. PFB2-10]|uniref:type I restriction enzyme HsdR N-terminal domain-containing protein n=1 Tax=Parabacteroides sp. PFB2-10 TaxID=1742405 RepID=UPI0024764CCB|nr:type I restriction enzyme HsdR N-terminal domain-containing protein [Parabacteroides sp. PFB2-10]MDH6311800.1 putative type IV restriction endonuclease [Parabacteroides sp. PFB2-10]MDL2245494.1 type I restriction enzyme HsdR N-terminal domain-containing protein [Parabacteroides sp. OttesenSCG-928-J18]
MLALNLPTYAFKVTEREGKKLIFDEIRNKYVALTPEEWVRQHFVQYLISEKGYPKNLVGNEIGIKVHRTSKRCDTVVYDRFLAPLMVLEYKAPTVEITPAVFDQIVRYNMTLQVRYLIVSNGMNHYCCRIDDDQSNYEFLEEIPRYEEMKNEE